MSTVGAQEKTCKKCGETKLLAQFHIDRSTPDGRKHRCRICVNAVRAKWVAKNHKKVLRGKTESYQRNRQKYLEYYKSSKRKQNWFAWKLNHQFGISVEYFDDLLKKQGGRCAICGQTPEEAKGHKHKHRLCVDHDHKTGKVRGLLCMLCNSALGSFQDVKERLLIAYDYLSQCENDEPSD